MKDFYTSDHVSAIEAQRRAQEIVFGPVVFQVARIMRNIGLLELLASPDARDGKPLAEICEILDRKRYVIQLLLESALSSGIVYRHMGQQGENDRYCLTKTGFFLYSDVMTNVLVDFMHDVCYSGLAKLDKALETEKPEGLTLAGDWPTLYEALDSLPSPMRESWFRYDHYFSDCTFPEALKIIFKQRPRKLLDLGGNTGKWALQCVAHSPQVQVTVMDLPQQIRLMRAEIEGKPGAERIQGVAADFLDPRTSIPAGFDAIWMSQFLDCFSEDEIGSILERAAKSLGPGATIYINEIFWDRQRFETAAFVLTQSSPYFAAIANGNSKFLFYPDLKRRVEAAGLEVTATHDGLGWGHTIVQCRLG